LFTNPSGFNSHHNQAYNPKYGNQINYIVH